MSTLLGHAVHPVNKSRLPVYEGFSWPCFFFGPLWFLYKNMWAQGLIGLVVGLFIAPFAFPLVVVAWLIVPFFANGLHASSLLERGYLSEKQLDEREREAHKPSAGAFAGAPSSIADELAKLARLRESGVLTTSEFETEKARLLGTR